MLDNSLSLSAGAAHEAGALRAVSLFLEEHGASLEAAARLLGGTRWALRVLKLRQEARDGIQSRHACLRDLSALGRLLRLESVSDPEADESEYFAMLNPADPRVHDICLLCDNLDQLIAAISKKHLAGPFQRSISI